MVPVAASAARPRVGARSRPGFRADIQGLRAVAVVAVVLDHAGVPGLGGGYAGVDVFFVISGYLIGGHLLSALRSRGRIALGAFYANRARRILPAAVTVIAVTAAASFFLVSPLRVATILWDGIASALYLPNVRFAIENTDYLAGTAPSPFQHFWSLGVEEQFYLLWPVLLIGLFALVRRSSWKLTAAIAVFAVLSFLACILVSGISQPWAFFSLPTRAWELATGCLVWCAAGPLRRIPALARRTLGWVGLALIVLSFTLLSEATTYPGVATLVPALGAALVIGAGTKDAAAKDVARDARGVAAILGLRPLQFLGAISYALYLVHWPLLVFAHERIGFGHPLPVTIAVSLAIAAVPVAYLLYRYVESPFRKSHRLRGSPRRSMITAGATSALLVLCLGLAQPASALMPTHVDRTAQVTPAVPFPVGTSFVPSNLTPTLAEATGDTGELYTDGCQQGLSGAAVLRCTFGATDSATVVALFGDSHAGRWFPALKSAAEKLGFRLETFTKSGCRSEETDGLWDSSANKSCSTWRNSSIATLAENPPDFIVLANHLGPVDGRDPVKEERDWEQGITSTIARLPSTSHVITLADTPQFASSPVDCLAQNLTNATLCAVPRTSAFNAPIARAELTVSARTGSTYLDLTDYFCNQTECPAVIGNRLVYSDEHHVTATFSEYIGAPLERTLAPILAAAAARVVN